MNEDFLHFLWKNRLFVTPLVEYYSGETIEVINPGQHNHDQGPDFFNARIKIGQTIWAGNVEIHLRASDWTRHKHQDDEAYNSVILHVVGENDAQITNQSGTVIPATEISCPKPLFEQYLFLMQTDLWLPCQSYISKIDPFIMMQWCEAVAVERIGDKTKNIETNLLLTKNNWEESFYYTVAQAFGLKVNAQPFLMLAQSLPLNVLAHHKNSLVQIEALLFGQSGLLPDNPSDEYSQLLMREYNHLRLKYSLEPLQKQIWKFARMRPVNFPTIRIAQLATLIFKSSALLSKVIECQTINEVKKLFSTNVSEYWLTHYNFGKVSGEKNKNFGDSTLNLLIINAFVPFMFLYGKKIGKPELTERAVSWLEQLPAEVNNIISNWEKYNVKAKCALESQALIQLYNCYCQKRQCLKCRIGRQVLSPIVKTN